MSISSVARVSQFEMIAALLFDPTADATADEFTMARMIYQTDQGLDSRVVRRYDPHFAVPMGTDCAVAGTPAMYPDYCVGPARLGPAILDALNGGIAGTDPRRNAARVEAVLVWFLAVSTYKESFTCTTAPGDCDSSYAYYTGGEPRTGGLGLARLVRGVDTAAHDRAWDGLLALRCWRAIEGETTVPATMTALRDQARAQYDRAVLDGVAAILRDRLARACAATGSERDYLWTFARTLAPYLDRELRERDTAGADALAATVAMDDPSIDAVAAAVDAIDGAFDCP
jgi:hypothetical protein